MLDMFQQKVAVAEVGWKGGHKNLFVLKQGKNVQIPTLSELTPEFTQIRGILAGDVRCFLKIPQKLRNSSFPIHL
jgi:hypothetical protein